MAEDRQSIINNLRPLDLNLLVALRALLDEQHVSRAADKAGLSQPGMSRALQRLREMFQDPLLAKSDNGYVLTERAQEIDVALRDVLADIRNILTPRKFNPASACGEFRIASLDYELSVLLPSIISTLRDRAPGLKITAVDLAGLDFGALLRDDVQLILTAFSDAPPNLRRQRLFDEDKVCLFPSGAEVSPVIGIEEFRRYDHVWVNLTGPDPGKIDETLAEHQLSRNVVIRVPSFLLAARVVAKTDLIAILPRRIANHFAANGLGKVVELPFSFPAFPVFQYWRDRYQSNPQHAWLRQLVAETASRETQHTVIIGAPGEI